MNHNVFLALVASVVAVPLSAAGVGTTHEAVATPPGKLHGIAFRPLKPQPCVSAEAVNPAGSRVHLPANRTSDCPSKQLKNPLPQN